MRKNLTCTLGMLLSGMVVAGYGLPELNAPPVKPGLRFILLAKGNQQEVAAGSVVRDPLMARVVDAGWQGVPNVAVRWVADSGAGLLTYPARLALGDSVTITDEYGQAAVYVQAIREGSFNVVATAAVDNSFVEFEVTGISPHLRTIFFGPVVCGDTSSFRGSPAGSVDVVVGNAVRFTLEEDAWGESCVSRLMSVRVPDGGASFASDTLYPGSPFRFTPNVPGTWVFKDIINGGEGRMTARIP